MIDELDYTLTYNAVCPYCGYEDGDSWEYKGEEIGEVDCGSCGEEFYLQRIIDIKYTSTKMEDL